MAAFIPLIPMVADAIAALINGVKNANDKNESKLLNIADINELLKSKYKLSKTILCQFSM